MARTRIFVSFDREHDADLLALLRSQAKRPESSFEILAGAQSGPANELSDERARAEIQAADEVVVLCGEHTAESKRVAAELGIAREESKPYLLLWGRREKMCTKPEGATNQDAMYSWTRDILESQISRVLENAKPRKVPENCKRMQG
jgi:hypothetical protein